MGPKKTVQNQVAKNSPQPFYRTIGFFVYLGQIFGLFPVHGCHGPSASDLKFSWTSVVTFYCILNSCITLLLGLLYFLENFRVGFDFWDYMLSVWFYGVTGTMMILFLKLAFHWPSLMKKWELVDNSMVSYGYMPYLNFRLKLLTTVLFVTALVETLLSKSIHLIQSYKCRREEIEGIFEYLMTTVLYKPVFIYTEYSTWKGVLLMIFNTTSTFAWSYGDVFVMIIGIGLALRFRQISRRLRLFLREKISDIDRWREIREDYQRLAILTKTVDNAIGNITCLCFASNLTFIIIQLFNSLRFRKDLIDKFYFFFSFAFLIARTFCVCLYAAWINDESREPIYILADVSSECFNVEVSRFVDQLRYDNITLSDGKCCCYLRINIFTIKRSRP
ncbi:gustatory receptor for sugar taste 64e-like isoform X2 [Agrilus planipennis]|uniref:Gustatory receptor n=1 Tax=Agrilus planipennis TaxID=224129 RepID=A0A7F5RG39_AGRPL|nr:gustatory receptor for sugar taste 64e-like isoform X2 [Agrilus planipennis]